MPSDPEFIVSLNNIFSAATTGVLGVIGWMLRSIYQDFKEAMKMMSNHEVRIAVLEEEKRQRALERD